MKTNWTHSNKVTNATKPTGEAISNSFKTLPRELTGQSRVQLSLLLSSQPAQLLDKGPSLVAVAGIAADQGLSSSLNRARAL